MGVKKHNHNHVKTEKKVVIGRGRQLMGIETTTGRRVFLGADPLAESRPAEVGTLPRVTARAHTSI